MIATTKEIFISHKSLSVNHYHWTKNPLNLSYDDMFVYTCTAQFHWEVRYVDRLIPMIHGVQICRIPAKWLLP